MVDEMEPFSWSSLDIVTIMLATIVTFHVFSIFCCCYILLEMLNVKLLPLHSVFFLIPAMYLLLLVLNRMFESWVKVEK